MGMAAARRSPVLLGCVLVTLAAHALLISGDWGSATGQAAVAARLPTLTLLPGAPSAAPSAVPGRLLADVMRPEREDISPVMPPNLAPLVEAPALPDLGPALPALGAALSSAATESRWDEGSYIPRPQLSRPPVMLGSVSLTWPEEGPSAGHYRDIIALYIDEQGIVQRVRIDGTGLPEVLQEETRQRFLGARFEPGQLDGREVKSLIRVEVEFDAATQVRGRGALR